MYVIVKGNVLFILYFNIREKYNKNRDEYMKISKFLAADGIEDPDLQLKITAFMSADVVVSNCVKFVFRETTSYINSCY